MEASLAQSLLLISSLESDIAFATDVAQAAGLNLLKTSGPVEGAQVIDRENPAIILVDASTEASFLGFERAIQNTIGLFSDKINPNFLHYLTSNSLEGNQHLLKSPLFGNLILRNFEGSKGCGRHYGTVIRPMVGDKAFGLARMLKEGSKIQVIRLKTTGQKQDAVAAAKNYLLACKFPARIASTIANAVDELLMNAMFDAPADDFGRPLFNKLSRTTEINLENKSAVEMHVGYDGEYVAFSVIDLYGSLDKAKLLEHLARVYADKEYKVRSSVAGAGIGLATVFKTGGSFVFASETRTRTEVTVFFRKTENFREFRDQFRFISTQFYF